MTPEPNSLKGMLQELKTRRWIQVALGLAVLLAIYVFWPDSPKAKNKRAGSVGSHSRLEPAQLKALQGLGDLAGLQRAGELPKEDRMYRDLFLFDTPAPPAPKPKPIPPPPPPSPEEIKAAQLRAARLAEQNTQPSHLRYLGFLSNKSAGRIGAFMKGEEPLTFKKGQLVNPKWRVLDLTEETAIFQNLTYSDIRYTLRAVESQGKASAGGRAPSNEF